MARAVSTRTGRPLDHLDVAFDSLRYGQTVWFRSGLVRTDSTAVMVGGLSDSGSDPEQVRQAAAAVLERTPRALPQARLAVVGPIWPDGNPSPGALAVRDALHREALRVHAQFVDPIADRWLTGTRGRGDGNVEAYIGPDGTHPTEAGPPTSLDAWLPP